MTNTKFAVISIFSFLSFIMFLSVRSSFSEVNNFENLFGAIGGICLAISIGLLISSAIKQGKIDLDD